MTRNRFQQLRDSVALRAISAVIIGTGLLAACSDARIAKLEAMNRPHHIIQFSGGKIIGEWNSTGQVKEEESGSPFLFFEDAKTKTVVLVSGEVQITVIPN